MDLRITHTTPKTDTNTLWGLMGTEALVEQLPYQSELWWGSPLELDPELHKKGKQALRTVRGQLIYWQALGKEPGLEAWRKSAHQVFQLGTNHAVKRIVLCGNFDLEALESIAESIYLSAYQFTTYKTKNIPSSVEEVIILTQDSMAEKVVLRAKQIAEATMLARDLVNEPVITLTAPEFGKRIAAFGKKYGFQTDVWGKAKIKSMKMGGILAVNSGSNDPPSFSILSYKPGDAINEKPIVLVGKGVVYDTGGLSLKPTANSMDFMKCDMAGAAAVVGAICGLASLKIPRYVIGLIPATDNRPGQDAFTPGDVIYMHDGTTVEVKNTDAEGRLILADALSYAKKYDPKLVIDLATLTGSAKAALGVEGMPVCSNADQETTQMLMASGNKVHERLVEFPLWEEYGEMLKSEIADISNLGSGGAGVITAAKFLEHFTDYPWMHLDIAGPAFLHSGSSYRGKEGTGVGVRLLIDFIANKFA